MVVAALAVVVFALVKLRLVVLPTLVALFISTVLSPPVSWLRNRGWPSLLATWTVVLLSAFALAGALTLLARPLVAQLGGFSSAMREGVEQLTNWLVRGPLGLSESEVEGYVDRVVEQLGTNADAISAGVVSGALQVVEFIAGAVLTIVLVFFFVKDGPTMFSWIIDQFPERRRLYVRQAGERLWATMGSYVRGVAIIAFVDAALIAIALLLVGVPIVVPLMALTFFGGFFPFVGAFVAGLVATLVTLVAKGPLAAAIIAISILGIQQIEGNVLQPVVMSRTVDLHPVVILLSLTAGAVLGGIAGAFLAVPIAAGVASLAGYIRSARVKSISSTTGSHNSHRCVG